MNDDEILDTIDRRFAGVEAQLPPRRVPIVDAATGSTLRRGPTLGPGPVPLTLIVVAAIAVTLALGSRLSTGVGGDARPSGSSAIAAVESDSAPASAASESPNVAPLLILRGSADGDTLLVEHFRWGPCLSSGYDSIAAPDGAAIDRAFDRAGVDEGWVDVEIPFARPSGSTMRGWVGATAESAAVGYGSPVIAFGGRGNTWIVQGGKGRQLLSFATPKGRTFWILANSVAKSSCGGATP